MKAFRFNIDSVGIVASGLCLAHCLLLPFLLAAWAISGTWGTTVQATAEQLAAEQGWREGMFADQPASDRQGGKLSVLPACCKSGACSGNHACAITFDSQPQPRPELGECCDSAADFWIHVGILSAVAPVGFLAIGCGYRKHRRFDVVVLAAVGVSLLAAALIFGRELWDGRGEQWMTVTGSVLMVAAHLWNMRDARCIAPCHAKGTCAT